jgi:hypothetical protein
VEPGRLFCSCDLVAAESSARNTSEQGGIVFGGLEIGFSRAEPCDYAG